MKIFWRLLGYLKPYRHRFALGVILSFFVALLNGVSLSALAPLFKALVENTAPHSTSAPNTRYYLNQFRQREFRLLSQALHNAPAPIRAIIGNAQTHLAEQATPMSPLPQQARQILTYLAQDKPVAASAAQLSFLERAQIATVIQWKLQMNAAAFTPMQVIVFTCLFIVPLYTLKLFLFLLCVRLIARNGYRAVRNIRNELFLKVQQLPLTWFYKNRSGELVSRLSNDVEIVAAVISSNMRDAITNVFYILVHIFILAYLNWQLLAVLLVAVPVILFPVTLFTHKIRSSTGRSQNLLADMSAHLQESISAMKVIRFAGMEKYEQKRFARINARLYWRRFKEIYYNSVGPYLVELNSVIVSLGVLSLGVFFLHPSDFTSSDFFVFIAVLLVIIRPVIQLSGMYAKIQSAIVAGQRMFAIMDQEFESNTPQQALPRQRLQKSICFENVCFTYPESETQVLTDISFTVPIGATIAFIGASGSGKSTLMDILAGFFRPTHGRILLDDNNMQSYDIQDHRARIGIVTQEIFLFYGSVYHNILYGSQERDQHAVEKAARLAHAHDFIMDMPAQYKTLLGNRGLDLSGGQRQRIAIARALLRDPEILILDEATSALDTTSERLVQHALERLFRNRTTFVIAHRLSTIEKADIIIVLANGRVIEMGVHEELLQKGGQYARLQHLQNRAQVST